VFLFPVFLDLAGRACLVAGGGQVGRDKARSLLEAGAAVTVVEPEPDAALLDLASSWPALRVIPRPFVEDDCGGCALVFACTGDAAVDASVLAAAAASGAPACASGSGGEEGDFSCGALLRRGDLCVAVSSGGSSPTLAAAARDRVAAVIGEEFAMAASMLSTLREELRRDVPDVRARRDAMRAAVGGGLVELLEAGHYDEAGTLVTATLVNAKVVNAKGAASKGQGKTPKETGSCTR
jgi:siroheme synthase-like protein